MEFRLVEAFLAVAEELHFGRAAERLHMAQSPLSQAIKKLEKDVGKPLFERSARTVRLTSAGHTFLPHARKILGEVDLAVRATAADPGSVYGRVRLGFSGALNHLTLPPLTRTLRSKHPDVELDLAEGVTTEDAVSRVERGSLDVAFVGLPVPSGLPTLAISVEALGAAMPNDHHLAGRESMALSELSDQDWILMPGQSALRSVTITACHTAGFHPRLAQEVKDPHAVLSMVAAGVGISLMPTCTRPIMPAGSVWIPLTDEPSELRSALLWHPDRVNAAVRALLDVAAAVLPTSG